MRVLLAGLLAMLSGCTGFLETNAPPVQSYVLRVTPSQQSAVQPLKGTLRVSRPLAAPGLESERIVLVQSDNRLSHFEASRWAASLPEVIEALAIEKLRGAGIWNIVQGSNTGFPSDYTLQMTVRRFDADYSENPNSPTVRVALDCIVARRTDRELLSGFSVEAVEPVGENRLANVVEAFERATNQALETVVERSSESVRTSKAPSLP